MWNRKYDTNKKQSYMEIEGGESERERRGMENAHIQLYIARYPHEVNGSGDVNE